VSVLSVKLLSRQFWGHFFASESLFFTEYGTQPVGSATCTKGPSALGRGNNCWAERHSTSQSKAPSVPPLLVRLSASRPCHWLSLLQQCDKLGAECAR
jgi:hypothetical protein